MDIFQLTVLFLFLFFGLYYIPILGLKLNTDNKKAIMIIGYNFLCHIIFIVIKNNTAIPHKCVIEHQLYIYAYKANCMVKIVNTLQQFLMIQGMFR